MYCILYYTYRVRVICTGSARSQLSNFANMFGKLFRTKNVIYTMVLRSRDSCRVRALFSYSLKCM